MNSRAKKSVSEDVVLDVAVENVSAAAASVSSFHSFLPSFLHSFLCSLLPLPSSSSSSSLCFKVSCLLFSASSNNNCWRLLLRSLLFKTRISFHVDLVAIVVWIPSHSLDTGFFIRYSASPSSFILISHAIHDIPTSSSLFQFIHFICFSCRRSCWYDTRRCDYKIE